MRFAIQLLEVVLSAIARVIRPLQALQNRVAAFSERLREEQHRRRFLRRNYSDDELIYAAHDRCPCGEGLAYPKLTPLSGAWDCAGILTGRAPTRGQPGAQQHTARLPFNFYSVKSEQQPSANGATTRPTSPPS